jgi:hypothetical protein
MEGEKVCRHDTSVQNFCLRHSFAFSASRRLNFSYKSILPCTARVFRSDSPGEVAQWLARSIRES